MPGWKKHGLLAIATNLQGVSPEGYSKSQNWETGAFTPRGELRPEFMKRMGRVLDATDEDGMVVILGYFYFGQSPRFTGDDAVIHAADNAAKWLLDGGWQNVIVDVNNFTTSIAEHVSWGWFDDRRKGEGLDEGDQSPPVNWGISSERKRAFFKLSKEITTPD